MSEIRVDSFKAEDGIGAPSFPNGIQVTGVVTATVLDATVPFLTVGSNAQLGNAGIVTATGLDINGNADVSGNLSVGGVLTYEDVKNIDSIGIITARSSIKLDADGSASSNFLSIGADDDLKIFHQSNVDKVQSSASGFHIRTINNGDIHIHAGVNDGASNNRIVARAAGKSELYYGGNLKLSTETGGVNISGIATISGDVSIADKIIHTGDTDTAIRFSAADTVSIETAGNEQVKFNHSTGTVLYNHIVPNNDSTKDIGTNSVRFRNIYADTIYGSGAQLTGIEGGKIRNYKHVVDAGYAASTWSGFTQIASFSYTPLDATSKIIVIASLNYLWENSNVHDSLMTFGSNSGVQFNKTAKAASISGWLSGNISAIFHLGTAGYTSSNSVVLQARGNGSNTSYFNYSGAKSQFLLLEVAPEG